MKKNVLKALFVGMVLSASLGVEAQPVSMADIPNMQAISRNRNTRLREKVQVLLNKMNERSELDWTGMCGLINDAVSVNGMKEKWAAVDALLPQIQEAIDAEDARRAAAAAAPVSSVPQPTAPAVVPQTPAPDPAAAAAAAAEEQEARQRQEAAINDLTSSILDRIEGLPGEKEIWISALEKILSISDLNRKIEALTYLKLKLEIFIATAAAAPVAEIRVWGGREIDPMAEEIFFRQKQEVFQAARRLAEMKARLVHAAAQVRQEQQRLFQAAAAAAADSDSFDIFDSVYQVPNTPLHFLLEEYQQRQQEVAQLQRQKRQQRLQAAAAAAAAYSPDVAHTPTPYKTSIPLNMLTDDASCENLRMMKNGTALERSFFED